MWQVPGFYLIHFQKLMTYQKKGFIVIYLAVLHILWNGFILYMPGVDIYDLGAVIFSSAKYLQGQGRQLPCRVHFADYSLIF